MEMDFWGFLWDVMSGTARRSLEGSLGEVVKVRLLSEEAEGWSERQGSGKMTLMLWWW